MEFVKNITKEDMDLKKHVQVTIINSIYQTNSKLFSLEFVVKLRGKEFYFPLNSAELDFFWDPQTIGLIVFNSEIQKIYTKEFLNIITDPIRQAVSKYLINKKDREITLNDRTINEAQDLRPIEISPNRMIYWDESFISEPEYIGTIPNIEYLDGPFDGDV